MKNEGKIEISVQPKEMSPTASREAYEFRQLVKQAGFIELDAVTQAEIGWFLPQGFNGEQLTTALNLYSQGVRSEKLEQQIDKSEKLLANLSERERQSLYAIPYLVGAFEEYDPQRSSMLQTAYSPTIVIQEAPAGAVSQENRFVFERQEEFLSPVIKRVAGRGIDLAKKKVKDFAVKAIEKGGKKLIKKAFQKGSGLAIKAGAKAAITAGAQAIGTTIPVIGNIVAFIATEVIPRLIKGVTKLSSAFLRAVTGEKDFRKQLRNLAAFVFVFALALGQPVLAGVAGFTAVSAQATILGSQGISAGIAGAGQAFIYGLYAVAAPAIGIPILVALIVTPLVIALILFIINSGAYIVPQRPPGLSTLVENPYIGVEKLARVEGSSDDFEAFLEFENIDLPVRIEYQITVTAKRSTLTSISFDWTCTVIRDPDQTCPARSNTTVNGESVPNNPFPPSPPDLISSVDPYEITYTMLFRPGVFNDSLTTDIFTVTADVESEGVSQTQAAASASVSIGDPPDTCPGGWPVLENIGRTYAVTQGPFTSGSHTGREAIDVWSGRVPNAADVVIATHRGTLTVMQPDQWGGLWIQINGVCEGRALRTWHVHFDSFGSNVSVGSPVSRGTILGIMGCTGWCTSPHDHYEFPDVFPTMVTPYVPVTIPRGCSGNCGINIP